MGLFRRQARIQGKVDVGEIMELRRAAAAQSIAWSESLTGEAARTFDDSRDIIAQVDAFVGTFVWSLLRVSPSPFRTQPGSYNPTGTPDTMRRARIGGFILHFARFEAEGVVTHEESLGGLATLTSAIPCLEEDRLPALALLNAAIRSNDRQTSATWLAKWICHPLGSSARMFDVFTDVLRSPEVEAMTEGLNEELGPELRAIVLSSYGVTEDLWLVKSMLQTYNELF